MVNRICALPESGTESQASRGFNLDSSSKDTLSDGESIPGKCMPIALTMYPVVAIMAQRECFSSAARNHRRVSSDPQVARPRGSKLGMGAEDPPMSSRPRERDVDALGLLFVVVRNFLLFVQLILVSFVFF